MNFSEFQNDSDKIVPAAAKGRTRKTTSAKKMSKEKVNVENEEVSVELVV